MPSKIQLDEKIWFLYILPQIPQNQASIPSHRKMEAHKTLQIDFTAVGAATSLKPPAARMRYTRLRRQIESGALTGTHRTPFASPAIPEDEKSKDLGMPKKRKRTTPTPTPKLKSEPRKSKEEARNEKPPPPIQPTEQYTTNNTTAEDKEEEKEIKEEKSSGYESSFSTSGGGEEESEDEMPLAKLSKKNIGMSLPMHQFPSSECSTVGMNGHGHGNGNGKGNSFASVYPGLGAVGERSGGFGEIGMAGMAGMGIEMGIMRRPPQHEREQAELRAVIPAGRAVFDGIGVAGWARDGNGNGNGKGNGEQGVSSFWKQGGVGGMLGGDDDEPRRSV